MKPTGVSATALYVALVLALAPIAQAQQVASPAADRLTAMGIDPGITSLVQYAGQGDSATVDLILAVGVEASAREPLRKVTPLHAAAAQGHLRLVERLIGLGVDLNAPDWHGVTPLVAASTMGHLNVVKALLRAGAKVDVVPAEAPTALIAAVHSGNLQLLEALLAAGASAHLADSFGTTPLAAARRANRLALVARLEIEK